MLKVYMVDVIKLELVADHSLFLFYIYFYFVILLQIIVLYYKQLARTDYTELWIDYELCYLINSSFQF